MIVVGQKWSVVNKKTVILILWCIVGDLELPFSDMSQLTPRALFITRHLISSLTV